MELKNSAHEKGEKSGFLSTFWRLAEFSDAERIRAATQMLQVLLDKQGQGKSPCDELKYAVVRLIRGLSSSRKCARLGFAMAFTQVLRTFPVVSTSSILETLKTELQLVNSDSKGEQREVIFGRALTYMSILQSDRIKSATGEDLTAVIKGLVKLRKKRAPLHLFCAQAIVYMLEKVSTEDFEEYLWPFLEESLSCGWTEASPDVLWLLLTAKSYHKNQVDKKFLSSYWGTKKIMSEKMFENLAKIVMQSTSDHPLVHPICSKLILLASENDVIASFWSNSIDEVLFASEKPNRKYLLMQLVPLALDCAKTPADVETILSHRLVSFIVKSLAIKKHPLYAACKQLAESIVSFSAKCQSGELQVAVVTSLVKYPGSVLFDSITKTKTLHAILNSFNSEATNQMIIMLQEIIRGEDVFCSNLDDDDGRQDMEIKQKWAVSSMTMLAGVSADQPVPQLNILQFLLLGAFFNIDKPDQESEIPQHAPILQCARVFKKPLNLTMRHCLQEAFFKILDKLSTHHSGAKATAKDQRPFISILNGVAQYAQVLLSQPQLVTPVKPFSPEATEAWNKVLQVTENISNKHSKDERMNQGHAFLLLFYLHGLQLFSDPNSALDVLSELHTCYDKASAKKRRRSVAAHVETEPEWVDVITDLLLSLLSQDSHLVRMVVNNVFQMLCPLMTQKTLGLILGVLRLDDNEDEDGGALGFEDDEEDEDEVGEEPAGDSEGTHDGEKVTEIDKDLEESEESESSGEDTDEEEVDDGYKESVKAALGQAAALSDQESDASDVDDETMFKMDAALAAVFQTRKKGKKDEKEKERQLMIYRNRTLDLIDILVQNNRSPSILLALIQPLLDLLELCQKDKVMKELGSKIAKTFTLVCKPGKLVPDPAIEKENLPIKFTELMEYSKKVSGLPVMMTYVASAALLVVRILLGLESDRCPSPVRTRSMGAPKPERKDEEDKVSESLEAIHSCLRQAVADYCTKRDISHIFLNTIMERQSTVMWPICETLLERSVDVETRVFCRSQICKMIASMITKQTVSNLSSSEWEPFATSCMSRMSKVVMDTSDTEIRPKYLQEVATVITHLLLAGDRQLYKNMDLDSITEKLTTLRHKVPSKDTRKSLNRLINLLQQGQGKAKKDKKRMSDQCSSTESIAPEVTPKKMKIKSPHENGDSALKSGYSKSKKKEKRKSIDMEGDENTQAIYSDCKPTDIKLMKSLNDSAVKTEPSVVNGISSKSESEQTGTTDSTNILSRNLDIDFQDVIDEHICVKSAKKKTPKNANGLSQNRKGSPSPGKLRRKSLRSAAKIHL